MLVTPADSGPDREEAILPVVVLVCMGSEVVECSGCAWDVGPEEGAAGTLVPGPAGADPVCPPDVWMAVCPAQLVSQDGVLWADSEVLREWVSVTVPETLVDVGVDLDIPESPVVKGCTRVVVGWPETEERDSSPEVVVCMLAPRLSIEVVSVGGIDPCVRVAASLVDWRLSLVEAGVERLCVHVVGRSVDRELVSLLVPSKLAGLLSCTGTVLGAEDASEAVLDTGLLPESVELGAAGVAREVVAPVLLEVEVSIVRRAIRET
ncbi:hypothetical protein H920_15654 [Fukomys damarensis]|uniref:Uncharacterized protein n=1 Tax=Fukomys damarensis TaxID=885580 RepID=A0A091CU37_FUKDA|nr:hypothetical protein H920_15654 [Fukomys damarensis]